MGDERRGITPVVNHVTELDLINASSMNSLQV